MNDSMQSVCEHVNRQPKRQISTRVTCNNLTLAFKLQQAYIMAQNTLKIELSLT